MKRQGTYGFTFDSKAEEWWHWTVSCQAIVRAEARKRLATLFDMECAYVASIWDEHDTEARHSPAQQQNGCEIGEGSGRPRNRVLWPLLAVAAMALVAAAGMAGWL